MRRAPRPRRRFPVFSAICSGCPASSLWPAQSAAACCSLPSSLPVGSSKLHLNASRPRHVVDRVEALRHVPRRIGGFVAELPVGPLDVRVESCRSAPLAVRSHVDPLRGPERRQPEVEAPPRLLAFRTAKQLSLTCCSITRTFPLRWLRIALLELLGVGSCNRRIRARSLRPRALAPPLSRRDDMLLNQYLGGSVLLLFEVASHVRNMSIPNLASGPSIGIPQNAKSLEPAATTPALRSRSPSSTIPRLPEQASS